MSGAMWSMTARTRARSTAMTARPASRHRAPRSCSTATNTSPARRTRPGSASSRRGTALPDHGSRGLAQIADTLGQPAAIGRLDPACDRWIYSACVYFGLDLADQQASGSRHAYPVFQAEYSRNLIFAWGARMDRVFGMVAGRTRSEDAGR
jgi:hypothetical protein